ncbi:hypothetical protein KM043_006171 [Ampulex compressa]|nr:hypothetical protein KM043_006171 [Ampulex compressa]
MAAKRINSDELGKLGKLGKLGWASGGQRAARRGADKWELWRERRKGRLRAGGGRFPKRGSGGKGGATNGRGKLGKSKAAKRKEWKEATESVGRRDKNEREETGGVQGGVAKGGGEKRRIG